jgi:probable DNA repair protein
MNNIFTELEQGSVLVCATARQARHWRWRFDRHQQALGRRGWLAPAVHAWRPWLNELWEQSLLTGGSAGSLGLLNDAQAELAWRELLTADSGVERLAAGTGGGLRALRRAWQTLHEWSIDQEALVAEARTPDAIAFAGWALSYRDTLQTRGWLDPAQLYLLLAEDIHSGAISVPDRLYWLGWVEHPPALTKLDRALAAAGCHTRRLAAAVSDNRVSRESFVDRAAEQRAMVDWLAEAAADESGHCHGLVLAEPSAWSLRSLREQILDLLEPAWRNGATAGLPVQVDRERRLADTGLARAALLLLRLAAGRVDYRDAGQVLRSPYLAGGEAESAGRAQLDLRLRAERQPDLSLAEILDITEFPAPRLRELLRAMQGRQRDSGTPRYPDDWVTWIEELLTAAGWPGDRQPGADEEAAQLAWQALLERFGSLGPVAGRMPLAAALRWLEREAGQAELTAGRREDGVQILSVTDALGLQFESLWMPGLHAEAWPAPRNPDPLLPLALQRRAGLPDSTPAAHGAVSAQVMETLLSQGSRCRLSCALSYDDRQCAPSPVLATLEPGLAADASIAVPPQERLQWSGELETLAADPAPAVRPDERVRGGSRLLQLQARCPARAFVELRLGAEEIPVPAFGLDAALRGQLLHRAVELLYTRLGELGLQPGQADCGGEVDAAVTAVLAAWARSRHPMLPALADIEHRRLSAQLRQLMRAEADRPPFRVVATEQPGTIQLSGLQLDLRLDRLDRLQDDSLLVIDYKTGRRLPATAWSGDRLAEPQLPLYAIANPVDGIAVLQINADGVELRGVSRNDTKTRGLRTVTRFTRGAADNWEDLTRQWRRALGAVAAEFVAGSCAIDRDDPGPALGQFAPLTRVYSMPDEADA